MISCTEVDEFKLDVYLNIYELLLTPEGIEQYKENIYSSCLEDLKEIKDLYKRKSVNRKRLLDLLEENEPFFSITKEELDVPNLLERLKDVETRLTTIVNEYVNSNFDEIKKSIERKCERLMNELDIDTPLLEYMVDRFY